MAERIMQQTQQTREELRRVVGFSAAVSRMRRHMDFRRLTFAYIVMIVRVHK